MHILQERLDAYKAKGLTRTLISPQGIDLSSNDYLGFSQENFFQINDLPSFLQGAGASRLLRGHLPLFAETENKLAEFVHREAALLFSSGYAANVGLFSGLLRETDTIFSDTLNHASIIDGIRLSKAKRIIYPHLGYDFLEAELQKTKDCSGLRVIVTESLFSMEGTVANLPHLVALAEKYDALLIVDEAHSTGLWGNCLVAHLGLTDRVFATVHTAGKTLGAAGAWVAGSKVLRDYLIHFARSFIYSTAPLPLSAHLLQAALGFYQQVGAERAEKVRTRARWFRELIGIPGNGTLFDESPIISIPVGDSAQALQISHQLQALGWDVRAIRPPTVPEGTARLRLTVKWSNDEAQLLRFASDLHAIAALLNNSKQSLSRKRALNNSQKNPLPLDGGGLGRG